MTLFNLYIHNKDMILPETRIVVYGYYTYKPCELLAKGNIMSDEVLVYLNHTIHKLQWTESHEWAGKTIPSSLVIYVRMEEAK